MLREKYGLVQKWLCLNVAYLIGYADKSIPIAKEKEEDTNEQF